MLADSFNNDKGIIPTSIKIANVKMGTEGFTSNYQYIKYGKGKPIVVVIKKIEGTTNVLNFVAKASLLKAENILTEA
jgi:hypothetical protein